MSSSEEWINSLAIDQEKRGRYSKQRELKSVAGVQSSTTLTHHIHNHKATHPAYTRTTHSLTIASTTQCKLSGTPLL